MERADAVVAEAVERGEAVGEPGVAADARVTLSDLRFHRPTQTGVGREDVLRELDAAIRVFEELDDDAGMARALCLGGKLRFWGGEAAAAIGDFERAARYAHDAGDHAEEAESLHYVLAAMHNGPMPIDEALKRFEEMRPRAEANAKRHIAFLETRAVLEAKQGSFDVARDLVAQARALAQELGLQAVLDSRVGRAAGLVELLAGEAAAAEHELRPACEGLERIGELGFLSSIVPVLIDAVLAQGRNDEALQLTERWTPERLTVPEDADAQIGWRRVRAKALARKGEFAEAERLCREAVEIAAGTDYLEARANAFAAVAEVLRLAGRAEESAAVLAEAIRLYDEKGNMVTAGALRTLLAEPIVEV